MEEEIWKSLDFMGFDGYEVSNWGRVKSLNYRRMGKEQIMKPKKDKDGYIQINLRRNKKIKCFRVHKLVALAFIPNYYNLPQVNHKDENKENNFVDNLEWVSSKENINWGSRNERVSKAHKGKPKSEEHKQKIRKSQKGKSRLYKRKPIQQYTLNGEFIRDWESTKQASEELNISRGNITNCLKERYKTCGGYLWKYK